MPVYIRQALLATLVALAAAPALSGTTKDVVVDRVSTARTPQAGPAADAMVVSVLLESPDGSLNPKSAGTLFHTGDRFRVKVLASREGRLSIFNTNPKGETTREPLWTGEVKVGQDTVTSRFRLEDHSGIDQVHVVLEPKQEAGVWVWLTGWLRTAKDGAGSKDVRLDVENTGSATYMVNPLGQGLVSTVSIVHTPR